MKTIVVSAVNLDKGGTGTILRECLSYLSSLKNYKIIAIVQKKEVGEYENIEYIEVPWAKKRWVFRLWCEYIYMYFLSRKIQPVYLWLSLHDTTPNVIAERRCVYCHNPFPFYKCRIREVFLNYYIFMFSLFSDYIYKINQKKNFRIIVQQDWIRREFVRKYKLDENKIIVSLPNSTPEEESKSCNLLKEQYSFIYPASPNSHKNFECVLEASRILEKKVGNGIFTVYLTIDGTENKYSEWLKHKWGDIHSICYLGFIDRRVLYSYYDKVDCLVFPSKLETWGLPISEFSAYKKPMLIADCKYAYETAAGSENVALFNASNPVELAEMMYKFINKDNSLLRKIPEFKIDEPVSKDWASLFELLLR